MHEPRQRQHWANALLASLGTLVVMGISSGCDASASIHDAQTAVAAVQTVVPGVQTALPGLQATVLAGSTAVAGVLANPQVVPAQLPSLLSGMSVDVKTSPNGVAHDAITQVSITATDVRGDFSQLDASSRRAAAAAAMTVAAQYYPQASVSLSILDTAGRPLVGATIAPGQALSIQ